MRICSHSLCNAPLNMVEEDKESAATGSLGLVETRSMELSISTPATAVEECSCTTVYTAAQAAKEIHESSHKLGMQARNRPQ